MDASDSQDEHRARADADCRCHERGEASRAAPITLDTSSSTGLRHTRGRPPLAPRHAFVLRRNSTPARPIDAVCAASTTKPYQSRPAAVWTPRRSRNPRTARLSPTAGIWLTPAAPRDDDRRPRVTTPFSRSASASIALTLPARRSPTPSLPQRERQSAERLLSGQSARPRLAPALLQSREKRRSDHRGRRCRHWRFRTVCRRSAQRPSGSGANRPLR